MKKEDEEYLEKSISDNSEEISPADEVYEEILEKGESSLISSHGDDLVSWSIEDFYRENGDIKSKGEMKSKPPYLLVKSSSGDQANFYLTKEVSKELSRIMNEVYNAHYGIKPFRDSSPKEKVKKIGEWLMEHKVISVFIAAAAVLLIFGQISSMVR